MRRISSGRLFWAILGILVLTAAVLVTHAADGRSSPAGSPALAASTSLTSTTVPGQVSTGRVDTGVASTGRAGAAGASPSLAYPVWCCSAGYLPGLTVTGQATVHGTGAAARTGAITRAVADATGQAQAVAGAAGITLGRIVNMQVSAAYYPYPLPMGAAPGTAGTGGAPAASGGSMSAIPCPATLTCPGYPGASMSATVTVTWAIP
jgi:hypothetical protein